MNEEKTRVGAVTSAHGEPGEPPEGPVSFGGHKGRVAGECGDALTLGPQHDPHGTRCDQAAGHYPRTDHVGPHPLGTRPGDRITWQGGGSVAGDPVPRRVTGTIRSNEGVRRAVVAGGGSHSYAHDLEGGNKGLSGSAYVVGELNTSYWGADGEHVPGIERAAIRVRTPRRCDHGETVCRECAESWMYDWEFYFGRTAGGRRLRAELGRDEGVAAMAAPATSPSEEPGT